jgi:hypothetical protein
MLFVFVLCLFSFNLNTIIIVLKTNMGRLGVVSIAYGKDC